jgi:3-phenylpropionate/trans-cinnamate dioxygenase ferredoxin subunit
MLPSAPGEYLVAREGEILCCPWHGWEFDITTGRAIFDPETTRVRSYPVAVEPADARVETYPTAAEGGMVVVYVGRPHDAEIRHRRPD